MKRAIWLVVLSLISFLSFSEGKREMRGAWIATVANIDWPTTKENKSEIQKQELVLLLDSLCHQGINTVIFQCRPTGDALYKSDIEPWSEWLTGKQGERPKNGFDPLQTVVEEAHKRGMEVHAWINPYRVTNNEKAVLAKNHLYYRKPELFVQYGGKIYFNPGLKETEEHLLKVLKDIVVRYDVDALHLDDYFYPYPVNGKDFPDNETFEANPRGFKNKGDWRRDNVNQTVKRIHEMLQATKPWVQFGISPFGVWRNASKDKRGSKTTAGITNYDDLYADVLLWAKEGWIDYIAPQLYWEIGKKAADYAVVARWWRDNIPTSCQLYFGLYASGLEVNQPRAWKTPNELVRQLHFNDKESINIDGLLFYSTHYFLRNPQGLLDSLRNDFFQCSAIPPVMKNAPEAFPPINLKMVGDTLKWDKVVADDGDVISYYLVYAYPEEVDCDLESVDGLIAKTTEPQYVFDRETLSYNDHYTITVTAVNRYRSESEPYEFVTYYKSEEEPSVTEDDGTTIKAVDEEQTVDKKTSKKNKRDKAKKERKKKRLRRN